jgi:hypothetical protein
MKLYQTSKMKELNDFIDQNEVKRLEKLGIAGGKTRRRRNKYKTRKTR